MSMISEQVKRLKVEAEWLEKDQEKRLASILLQAADTIESLSAKLQAENTERSAEDCGGWIPCSERLPEESLNSVIGWDEYRKRPCFVQYIGGRWALGNDSDVVNIIAWRPLPEPYRGAKAIDRTFRNHGSCGWCSYADTRKGR